MGLREEVERLYAACAASTAAQSRSDDEKASLQTSLSESQAAASRACATMEESKAEAAAKDTSLAIALGQLQRANVAVTDAEARDVEASTRIVALESQLAEQSAQCLKNSELAADARIAEMEALLEHKRQVLDAAHADAVAAAEEKKAHAATMASMQMQVNESNECVAQLQTKLVDQSGQIDEHRKAAEEATMAAASAEIQIASAETRVAELESTLNQVQQQMSADAARVADLEATVAAQLG